MKSKNKMKKHLEVQPITNSIIWINALDSSKDRNITSRSEMKRKLFEGDVFLYLFAFEISVQRTFTNSGLLANF